MDIGFEQAGFKTVWANEYDKTIAPSYQNYFPGTRFDGRSILSIPDEDIPPVIVREYVAGKDCLSIRAVDVLSTDKSINVLRALVRSSAFKKHVSD